MRVRKLDKNGDMTFGRGIANYWIDAPEGVAQCVQTRLWERVGEWFLDKSAGMPWETQVLGRYTESTRDPAVRARILGTIGVRAITAYFSGLDRNTRRFGVQVTIDTLYGRIRVTALDPGALRRWTPMPITDEFGRPITTDEGEILMTSNSTRKIT